MRHIIIFTTLLVAVSGCSKSNNPVSTTTISGTLQYSLTSSKESYTIHDTLNVTLTARNVGSTTDTVAIGSAVLCTWSLENSSRKVMFSGANNGSLVGFIPIAPGKSEVVDEWIYTLVDSSGNALPAGFYTFYVNYGQNLLSLKLTVQ